MRYLSIILVIILSSCSVLSSQKIVVTTDVGKYSLPIESASFYEENNKLRLLIVCSEEPSLFITGASRLHLYFFAKRGKNKIKITNGYFMLLRPPHVSSGNISFYNINVSNLGKKIIFDGELLGQSTKTIYLESEKFSFNASEVHFNKFISMKNLLKNDLDYYLNEINWVSQGKWSGIFP